ncbi:MAG: hypothetical protein AB1746_10620 [Candidatus Zixiibacteriota bacterium]
MKNKKLQRIKNNLIYSFTIFLKWLFNVLPRCVAVHEGRMFGYFAYLFSSKERATAHKTLKMVYGESLSEQQRENIIKNLFLNFGKNLVDVFRFLKHYRRQIKGLIDVEGLEYFDAAYNRGKGVVAVTGHIGNFELLAVFFAERGYRVAVIGREMYDRRLDEMLTENRAGMGIVNISTTDSPRRIMKVLRDGYALGVLMDTDSMRVRSEFVPAFGKLSYTPVGQSILGLKAEAGFIPMACVREGRRYKVIIKPEIRIKPSEDFDKDVYNITAECTRALEDIIDKYRDQWIWIHNRWLTRPVDERTEKVDNKDNE